GPNSETLTKPAPLKVTSNDGSVVRYVSSNINGNFKIGGLPTQSVTSYIIEASPPVDATQGWSPGKSNAIAVSSFPVSALQIKFSTAAITGKVVNAAGTG